MAIIINGQGRVGIRVTGGSSPSSTLWNNLKAYYTGDNTPNDSLGNYNGTLVNGATYATGKINNGFSFDGINDYISISPLITTNIKANPHTYSAWVNANNLSSRKWIIQCAGDSKGSSMTFESGKLTFWYEGQGKLTSANTTLSTGVWYHVVITYDGVNTVKFYVNGVSDGTANVSSWNESGGVTYTTIGSLKGVANFFNGKIDEVATWGRALSDSEVTELYNLGAGKQYPN
jgi:hypothetical protein